MNFMLHDYRKMTMMESGLVYNTGRHEWDLIINKCKISDNQCSDNLSFTSKKFLKLHSCQHSGQGVADMTRNKMDPLEAFLPQLHNSTSTKLNIPNVPFNQLQTHNLIMSTKQQELSDMSCLNSRFIKKWIREGFFIWCHGWMFKVKKLFPYLLLYKMFKESSGNNL